jgi:molybdate transport system substrate-binding protein
LEIKGGTFVKSRVWSLFFLLLVGLFALAGCNKPGAGPEPVGGAEEGAVKKTLVIGAAASLNEAFTELGRLFEAQNPGWKVEFSFAGSGNLKTGIEQGAPLDVFAPAAEKQMNELLDSGHIDPNTVRLFAKNELVMVVPQNSSVNSREEIIHLDIIAVGEPESVPAGQYAKESLTNLGYWEQLEGKLVFTKDVRQALFYVERGEADAGFVYATDAAKSETVRIVTPMPEESYQPVLYPIGILSNAGNREGAEMWVELVTGDQGQGVLSKYGFQKP